MKQAIIIKCGNPEIDYDRVIATAWKKVTDDRGDELSDEEMLALYMKENPSTIGRK